MRPGWWNDYVGLPYREKGRERSGLDCWGLVRLVYAEQLGIVLPCLADDYAAGASELVAMQREQWRETPLPRSGDLVLCRIEGDESHVGVVTQPGFFLHVREGRDAVIERMDAGAWRHRIVGVFRYCAADGEIALAACPHPLKTHRIDAALKPGMSLAQIAESLRIENAVHLSEEAVVAVDGEFIPKSEWARTFPAPGSRVEYRAVLGSSGGGGIFKLLATVAIMAAAWYVAPAIAGAGAFGAAGYTALGGATLATALISAGINIVGGLLLNAIFPTRPTTPENYSAGAARPSYLLQGGQNSASPYGAVPVVLGRMRFTPPVGAENYTEASGSNSYLRMLLVWGYGPLQIGDLAVGDTPLSRLEEVTAVTLDGWDTPEEQAAFNRVYGRDVEQHAVNLELTNTQANGAAILYRTFEEEVDTVQVTLHFPNGLYKMPVEGSKAGKRSAHTCRAKIQLRQVGETSWVEAAEWIAAQTFRLPPAWFNIDGDAETEPVFQWTRVSLDKHSNMVLRHGAYTTNPDANPSGSLLSRLQAEQSGLNVPFTRLPDYGPEEEGLWDICVYGDGIHTVIDRRSAPLSGCGLSLPGGRTVTIGAGSVTRIENESVTMTRNTADAFSYKASFSVPHGRYEVRVWRTDTSETDFSYPSGNKGQRVHACVLQSITGLANRQPVAFKKWLAKTALRIKATDQLNGTIDGITGTVTSICPDWDRTTSTWVWRPTRNPASLYRWVLQHPGNARPKPDSQIDLAALADWHDYCRINGFMFDDILTGQRGQMDVLRDICAAGRASPTRRDGLWSVIVDRPRNAYAQCFTPHNSWGFEGVRVLPKLPHGFRVRFNNAMKSFQPDEMVVYADGYHAGNATLFEGLTLPGVTTPAAVYKHARFHMAQLILRPERYTLNADFEQLVCTRGDLVKVTHHVPMWGLGSGRIKSRIDATTLLLDEAMPMDGGAQYTVRIRMANGQQVVRTVAAKASDGRYDRIELTAGVSASEAEAGNLFMFGALGEEAVDCVVLHIEPLSHLSARLTLVDYSPAVYDSDTEVIPPFDSQVTLPPRLLQPTITALPTITAAVSDETAMRRLPTGQYEFAIRVSFSNPKTLPGGISHVEGQLDFAEDTSTHWQFAEAVPVGKRSIVFAGVQEGDSYRLRLRYVDRAGRAGPWTATVFHTVVGRTTPPPAPSSLQLSVQPNGNRRFVMGMSDAPLDLRGFMLRYNTGASALDWDQMTPAHAGILSAAPWETGAFFSGRYHFRAKAIDDAGILSTGDCLLTVDLRPPINSVMLKTATARSESWA